MKRYQQILAAVLVVQIILGVVTFWPRSADTREGKPVFEGLTAEEIVALTITDDQSTNISLRKVDGAWVLPDADNYPALETKITPVLEKLLKLNTGNLVARTDTSHKALKVGGDSYLRRVDIETADGTEYVLYLGTAPRYTATHFRVAGEVETYLTSDLSTWELNTAASGWIDAVYVSIDKATLSEIVLENAQGTFTLLKAGETWTLAGAAEGDVIAQGKVDDIVNKATQMSMQEPLGNIDDPAYGLDAPRATVTLKTADGGVTTLRVGGQLAGSTNYIVKSSESAYYVVVAEFSVKSLVENAYEDFLQVPTPTPAPAP